MKFDFAKKSIVIPLVLLIASCNQATQSDTKVVNGLQINDNDIPEVVQIAARQSPNSMDTYSCTATWVSPTTILTAAHCVEENGRVLQHVSVDRGHAAGAKAIKVLLHPNYFSKRQRIDGVEVFVYGNRDFAILVFPPNTASRYLSVYPQIPAAGENLEIIGFGKYDHLDHKSGGAKRRGSNRVTKFDQNYGQIRFDGFVRPNQTTPGTQVVNSQGDSGGPMLIGGKLAGVSSIISATGRSSEEGSYVSVMDPVVLEFVKSTFNQGVQIAGLNFDASGAQIPGGPSSGSNGGVLAQSKINLKVIPSASSSNSVTASDVQVLAAIPNSLSKLEYQLGNAPLQPAAVFNSVGSFLVYSIKIPVAQLAQPVVLSFAAKDATGATRLQRKVQLKK